MGPVERGLKTLDLSSLRPDDLAMNWTRTLGRMTMILGPTASVVYVVFAFLAYSLYPTTYGPFNNNWLSDLGDRTANPDGAGFYAIGCVATGLMVIGAFAGLWVWRSSTSRVQKYLLASTQLAGVAGGVAVIMSAIYSIDQFTAHQFWSRAISASFAVALFVAPFALRRAGFRLWPLILTSALGYCSIVARLVFAQAHWLEWPSIGLLLAFMWVIAFMTAAQMGMLSPRSRPTFLQA